MHTRGRRGSLAVPFFFSLVIDLFSLSISPMFPIDALWNIKNINGRSPVVSTIGL